MSGDAVARPLPTPTDETRGYWEGCRLGELRLQRCTGCSRIQFPPRRFCSGCLSAGLEWFRASGRGTVWSHSVVRYPISPAFSAEVPYVVALIRLEEGPSMMAGVRECSLEEVRIGMAVEVAFEPVSDEIHLPYFHPARPGG